MVETAGKPGQAGSGICQVIRIATWQSTAPMPIVTWTSIYVTRPLKNRRPTTVDQGVNAYVWETDLPIPSSLHLYGNYARGDSTDQGYSAGNSAAQEGRRAAEIESHAGASRLPLVDDRPGGRPRRHGCGRHHRRDRLQERTSRGTFLAIE